MKTTIQCELINLANSDKEIISNLMQAFCSAVRYSYKRLLEGHKKDIEKQVQMEYTLNSRYSKDAVEQARQTLISQKELLIIQFNNWQSKVKQAEEALQEAKSERKKKALQNKLEKRQRKLSYYQKHIENKTLPPVIFGGRKNFLDRCKGNITREQWQDLRDNRLLSRGDKTKKGNLNTRIIAEDEGNFLRISTPEDRTWIKVQLYIPQKLSKKTGTVNGRDYRKMLLEYAKKELPYQCEIIRRDGRYFCNITIEEKEPERTYTCHIGINGIDTNPDGVAITEVTKDGNFKQSIWIGNGELTSTRTNRRGNIIGNMAKEAVNAAKASGKGIAIEDLKFADDKDVKSKFARKKHQFIYRKLLQAIERRAAREGVEIEKVKPQYTSTIGKFKYMHMYGLNIHQSAGLVIGRRALGYKEKVPTILKEKLDENTKEKYNKKQSEWSQWAVIKKYYKEKVGEVPGIWQKNRRIVLGLGTHTA